MNPVSQIPRENLTPVAHPAAAIVYLCTPPPMICTGRNSACAMTRSAPAWSWSRVMAGPLHGIKVIEIGQALAGPLAGVILADMGAEVIKVEKPDGGDDARLWGPPFVGRRFGEFPHQQPRQEVGHAGHQERGRRREAEGAGAARPTS